VTRDEVLAAFPIGSTVKQKDGTPFAGREATGTVDGIYGYVLPFVGLQYEVGVVDANDRTLGDYKPSELERA